MSIYEDGKLTKAFSDYITQTKIGKLNHEICLQIQDFRSKLNKFDFQLPFKLTFPKNNATMLSKKHRLYKGGTLMEWLREFNIWTIIIRLFLAAILGGIIGLERGRQRRAAGLRTHILVCVGSALTVMVGFFAREALGIELSDPLRVSAQVISGIGFLGAGTIMLKGRFQIVGLTTAAGLWVTAAIGLSSGIGFYEGAIAAFLISIFTVIVLNKLERHINDNRSNFGVYVEIKQDEAVRQCINDLKEKYKAHDIQVTVPRSGIAGNVGIEVILVIQRKNKTTLKEVIEEINEYPSVVYAIESI